MWRHLFPEGSEQPVGYVTNGVHTATWVGPEMRTFYAQHLDPQWEQKLLEPRGLEADPRGPRRRAVGGAPRAEGAADPLRARARARAVRAARPDARRAAARRGAARPARADDRLRPPLRHLQARVPDHVRPRAAARDHERRRSGRCSSSSPARRTRPTARARRWCGGCSRSPTASSAASSCSSRTTTSRSAARWCRAATCGSTPRAGRRRRAARPGRRCRSTAASTSACSTAGGPRATAATTAGPIGDGGLDPDTAAQDRGDAESLYHILADEVVPRFFTRDESGLPREWIRDDEGVDRVGGRAVQRPPHGARLRRSTPTCRRPTRATAADARLVGSRSGRPGVEAGLVEPLALGHRGADERLAARGVAGCSTRSACAAQACVPSPERNSSPTSTTNTRRRVSGESRSMRWASVSRPAGLGRLAGR